MITNGLNEIELETIENVISLEDVDTSKTRKVKVFFPKLMPFSKIEEPKSQEIKLNKNLLLNDISSTKDNINKITLNNYIEIPLAKGVFENENIKKGDHLYVMIPNKNIKDMKIICI